MTKSSGTKTYLEAIRALRELINREHDGGSWLELTGDVDLQKDGIKPGDWYVIYAIEPGQRVNVFGSCSFSRK